jgi:hypothetical protein
MSDSSGFSMRVLWLRSESVQLVSELLTTSLLDAEGVSKQIVPKRVLKGFTRGDWFKECVKCLVEASGVDNLNFLYAQDCTHEYIEIQKFSGTDDSIYEYKTLHQYTLIYGEHRFAAIIASLNRLIDWCYKNPDAASRITDYVFADGIKKSIENSFYTLSPNSEAPGDEGQGPDFLFCTLKTIGELIRYAKCLALVAVYNNESALYDA